MQFKGLGVPNKYFATQNKQMYIRLHRLLTLRTVKLPFQSSRVMNVWKRRSTSQKSSIISVKSVWKRCHMDLPGSTNLIQRKASRTSRLQPLHAKFLLCHDGIIRGVIDLLAVDRIFYWHGSTLLIYKKSFSFFSRFFQILSVLCRTDTILFLEYPTKIEGVIVSYDL